MAVLKINPLRNSRGGMMTMLLVGSAISFIVMVAMQTILTNSSKNTQQLLSDVDFSQKMLELNLILRNKGSCTKSLANIPLQTGKEIVLKNYNGNGVFLQKGKTSIKGINIQSFQVEQVTIEPRQPTEASVRLGLQYVDTKGHSQKKNFFVFVQRNTSTNIIQGCAADDAFIPGQVYSRCYMQLGPAQQNLYGEKVQWPFTACPGPGTGKQQPQCAAGFQVVLLNMYQGNTDHAVYNMANKIYWATYGCAKVAAK